MIKEVVMTRVMRREDMKRVAMKKEAMKKEATINCVVQLIESVVISKINPTLLYRYYLIGRMSKKKGGRTEKEKGGVAGLHS